MVLLPEIDTKKTQDNVKAYLKQEFPRLVVQAGYSMLEVQSPGFGGVGSSGSNIRNKFEDNIVDHFESRPKVWATVKAIERCPNPYRSILKKLYIKEISDMKTQLSSGYSHSQYQTLKNKSFLWFADSFQSTVDLHVYKKTVSYSWNQFT